MSTQPSTSPLGRRFALLLVSCLVFLFISTNIVASSPLNNGVPSIPAKYFKKLQGPPSEFSLHQYPTPSVGAIQSDSFLHVQKFKKLTSDASSYGASNFEWIASVAVDSSEQVDLSLLSPKIKSMTIQIFDQHNVDITATASVVVEEESFGAFSD